MSDNTKAGPEPGERVAIGITFGNSNSSIAYTVDDKAEVIANEDGGKSLIPALFSPLLRLSAALCLAPKQASQYPNINRTHIY